MLANVAQILHAPALAEPDRVAAVTCAADGADPVAWTYGALDLAARRVAATLAPGERVALVAGQGPAFVAGFFGAAAAGAVVVPVPTTATAAELARYLDHARCARVLADREHADLAHAGAARAARPVAVCSLDAFCAADAAGTLGGIAPRAADDPALILYTSGTLGGAKGVVISHGSLVAHARAVTLGALGIGRDDCILGVLPLSHSFGLRMVLFATLVAGARCILPSRFSARGSLAAAATHAVTWIPAVPTMYAAWGALPDGPRLARVRWGLSAGAPLADGVRERAEARLGVEVREGYGMTEATFATLNAPPDARVAGSVGRPSPGCAVRVIDGQGANVAPGEVGELLLRGPNQMLGYLDDPDATAQTVRDGWVHSGDLGSVDAEGRVFVVDRKKDIILRGGHTIYPSEVEQALADHPDVAQVAVVGRPDAFYGEEIVAVVVPRGGARPTLAALRAWARGR